MIFNIYIFHLLLVVVAVFLIVFMEDFLANYSHIVLIFIYF